MEFYEVNGKKVRMKFKDGEIIEGYCTNYASDVDNPNGIASCSINGVGVDENEVEKIEEI